MTKIDPARLARYLHSFRNITSKQKLFILLTAVVCVLSAVISSYKCHKLEQCQEMEMHAAPIQDLQLDDEKRNFILRHKFSGTKTNFREFVEAIAKQNYAKDVHISLLEDAVPAKVKICRYKIEGLFWHDRFIFNFLDGMQDFAPGFLEISHFEINRFARNVLHSPVLKLEVLCNVFQR